MTEALILLVGTVITAFAGWLGTKATAHASREAARGPEWQAFTDKIMEAQRMQLEDRDSRIESLEAMMAEVRHELDSLRGRYATAISHIRDWRRAYPDGGPACPQSLLDDVT